MRAVAVPGRLIWGGIGLVTAVTLAIPGARLIVSPGMHWNQPPPQAYVTRTVTVQQPVTSLNVQSYGADVQVTTGPAGHVQVTEQITYDKQAGPPSVTATVSAGHLTLAAPACANTDCSVGFSVTVPRRVSVTVDTGGGNVTVSGTAGADVDSEGGQVSAARIDGPLTVASGGGQVTVNGLAGPLHADCDGGNLTARDVDTTTAKVSTGGGDAWMAFTAAPDRVTVDAAGGGVTLIVPGGPYALSANTEGGSEQFGIATDPASHRSITIDTGGGDMLVRPAPSRSRG
jgi:hypothetical protein